MSNARSYFNTSNRTNGYDSDETHGGLLSSLNNNLYFYTLCTLAVLTVFYVVFYIARQYEYTWAYGPVMDKVARYMPGVKKSAASKPA